MTLAQSLTAIIIFWAIIGGLGASLLLPAMQSLIHGNFEGAARKKAYALVGAAAAIAAAVGPLLGGFVTTYLSWRVGFALEVVVIASSCRSIKLVRDVAVHRPRADRPGRRGPLRHRHGRRRPRASSSGRRAASSSACSSPSARSRWRCWPGGSCSASAQGKPTLLDPDLFRFPHFTHRDLPADAAADHAGRGDDRAADLPADDARVQRDGGRALARAAVAEHVRASRCSPGRKAGEPPSRPTSSCVGFALTTVGMAADHPGRAREPTRAGRSSSRCSSPDPGWACWCRSSTTTRCRPIEEERVSEAAGVNSAAGSFGLSFGLADGRRHHARRPLARASRT